jgi:hypothetical protein
MFGVDVEVDERTFYIVLRGAKKSLALNDPI